MFLFFLFVDMSRYGVCRQWSTWRLSTTDLVFSVQTNCWLTNKLTRECVFHRLGNSALMYYLKLNVKKWLSNINWPHLGYVKIICCVYVSSSIQYCQVAEFSNQTISIPVFVPPFLLYLSKIIYNYNFCISMIKWIDPEFKKKIIVGRDL